MNEIGSKKLCSSKSTDKLYLVSHIIECILANKESIKTLKIEWREIDSDTIVPDVVLELYEQSPRPYVKETKKSIDPTESMEV